LLYTVAHKIYI